MLVCAVLPATNVQAADPPKVLRWGGDKEGGAPYIFEDKNEKLTGFEVELADYLASKLGMRAEFVQKAWESLPQHLKRGDIDLVLNGYEWSREREQAMASTIPYYLYRIQLLARKNDSSIRSWADLRAVPGQRKKRIGVLRDSAAHRYLEKEYDRDVQIEALGEEGTTSVMNKVVNGALDATVQDLPAAQYYVVTARQFPELRFVGEGIEPGYYVMFVRSQDTLLRDRLNAAILDGLRDGTLRRIYERYGLWNADQQGLEKLAEKWPPQADTPETEPDAQTNATSLGRFALLLTQAAGTTVLLSFLAMPLAILIGLLVAVGRLYGPRWLNGLLTIYVELLRGTPLLLQLSVIYFMLPEIGISLSAFWAGVVGLAINYSAYEAENYRAGFLAIPSGQMEAALSLGMSIPTALRRVIIPQAVRIVIPPVTNDFIALFKDTSVCTVIAVSELTGRYRSLAIANPRLIVELALMTAFLYLLMSYPLSLVARRLERRFSKVTA
jgi:polar amino acid transport system substrate-binding protein